MSDNSQFMQSINLFIDKAKANQEEVVRTVGLKILARIVPMSPVDTGRFRGNWQVTFNAPATEAIETIDPNGNRTISEGYSVLSGFKIGMSSVYITNCLAYAYRLEMGYSMQAPAGMIRVTAAEVQQYVDESVREVNK